MNVPSDIRFLKKVRKTKTCWIWTGAMNKSYGHLRHNKIDHKAHRFSYLIYVGEIPDGMHVLHTCDNPVCVNPAHLFIGTAADNMRDRMEKGRAPKGDGHPNSKLTEDDIPNVFKFRRDGYSQYRIAKIFGVARMTIAAVLSGKTWSHVDHGFPKSV